jgi:hypothetical protein
MPLAFGAFFSLVRFVTLGRTNHTVLGRFLTLPRFSAAIAWAEAAWAVGY